MSTTAMLRGGSWAAGAPTRCVLPEAPGHAPAVATWALVYLQPLQDWWDNLLGNPASVSSVASSWETVETSLVGVGSELECAQQNLDELEGRMIRTLDLRYSDLIPVARDAADWSGAIAGAARLASSIVEAVRAFILDFLRQLSRVIDSLFGFDLNPFDKVEKLKQLTSASFELIRAGGELLQKMFDAFQLLVELLGSLGPSINLAIQRIRSTSADMMPLGGALGFGLVGLLGGGIARDALTSVGKVSRYDIDELRHRLAVDPEDKNLKKKVAAWEKADKVQSLSSLGDLVRVNGTTDEMGGPDSSAIDIKLVRATDDTEHWVVSLPSTQEWFDMAGDGAMNDGKNNIALLFDNPLFKTQYEGTTLRAMREAGMSPGDPVVFTGFSQGGIMAANLASDPTLPYRPIGVVTNGSPIDTFDVPKHIPVISFQFATDIVPALDGNHNGGTPNNVQRVTLLPIDGDNSPLAVHNNTKYADAVDHFAGSLSEKYSWMGGDVVDHQVFSAMQQ